MTDCINCQKRRKQIAELAKKAGTLIFGGRKRAIADFSDRNRTEGDPAGMARQYATARASVPPIKRTSSPWTDGGAGGYAGQTIAPENDGPALSVSEDGAGGDAGSSDSGSGGSD